VSSSTSLEGSKETGDLPLGDRDPNPTPYIHIYAHLFIHLYICT
jgi:hypothetical protein